MTDMEIFQKKKNVRDPYFLPRKSHHSRKAVTI